MLCDARSKVANSDALSNNSECAVIYVVDDDPTVREALCRVLKHNDYLVEDFASCEAFLAGYDPEREACLILDAHLPGMSGLELLQYLREGNCKLPTVMITGDGDVPTAVRAMKLGAADFLEKPLGAAQLISSVTRIIDHSRDAGRVPASRDQASRHMSGLTPRQHEIMGLVLAGHPNKNIAADLGISQRTVENHRAAIMTRTGVKSLPALTRLALAASWDGSTNPLD